MLSSTPLPVDSSICLRALLDIRETSDFRCHGVTTKGVRCRVRIPVRNALTVEGLLNKGTAAESQEERLEILHRIAPLSLCTRWHQRQRAAIISVWEKLIKDADVLVKLEPNDEIDYQQHVPPRVRTTSLKQESPQSDLCIKTESRARDKKARPSEAPPNISPGPLFQPYSDHRTVAVLNYYVKVILSKPLTPKILKSAAGAEPGSVYAYTFPASPNLPTRYLKIGFTNKLPRRLKEIENACLQKPKLLCHFDSNLYRKVEPIVHAHLANQRLLADPCHGCGVCHKEWFEIRLPKAAAVIGLWTDWSLREPYDERGLLKAEWRKKLEQVDLSDQDCWEEYVYGQ